MSHPQTKIRRMFELVEPIATVTFAKGPDEAFRVWVLGCATGEEAYSIAILRRLRCRQQPAVAAGRDQTLRR